MTVYIDDMWRYPAGQFGRMKMSHMIADTLAELHAMADRIGMRRAWFQAKASYPHYDVSLSMRAKAVEYGAVEITWKQSGCMCSIAKTGLPMGDPATAEARFLEMYEARKAARSL